MQKKFWLYKTTILLPLILGVFLIRCDLFSNNIDISGKIVENFFDQTVAATPEKFEIDGKLIQVKDDGSFDIESKMGAYNIFVEAPGYKTIDTTITFNKDRKISLELKPDPGNFFDFEVGSRWVYSGERSISSAASNIKSNTIEDISWELIKDSVSAKTKTTVFVFSSYYSAVTTATWYNGENEVVTEEEKESIFTMNFIDGYVEISGENFFPEISSIIRGHDGYEFDFFDGSRLSFGKYFGLPSGYPRSETLTDRVRIESRSAYFSGSLLMRRGQGISNIQFGRFSNSSESIKISLKSFEPGFQRKSKHLQSGK